MQKKLISACAALAALAAVTVTPAASASPVLTENGTAVTVGSSITAKNTGNVFFTVGGSTLACESVDMKGTLANTYSPLEVQVPSGGSSFSGTGPNGDCTSSLGPFRVIVTSQLCFKANLGTDTLGVTGCGGNNKFAFEFTSLGTCEYLASFLEGTVATGADSTVNLSKQPYAKVGGGIFCFGIGQLDMDLDLTTTDGTTLTIS